MATHALDTAIEIENRRRVAAEAVRRLGHALAQAGAGTEATAVDLHWHRVDSLPTVVGARTEAAQVIGH